jgi:DNA-binding NtrC family response regulator
VLQERRFERVGGSESIEVDVRVIAATNRSLQDLVRKGKFREDLYYRINVVRIELPPLRERPEDITLLASHFCQKYARPGESPKAIAPEAMEVLFGYSWPGNVRELENVLERACVTCKEPSIELKHLGPELTQPTSKRAPFKVDIGRPLPDLLKEMVAEVERRYLRKALRKTRGNVARCAEICGLSRRSVTTKISEYGIKRSDLKDAE